MMVQRVLFRIYHPGCLKTKHISYGLHYTENSKHYNHATICQVWLAQSDSYLKGAGEDRWLLRSYDDGK